MLKLHVQAMSAFQVLCKHTVVNMHYIHLMRLITLHEGIK